MTEPGIPKPELPCGSASFGIPRSYVKVMFIDVPEGRHFVAGTTGTTSSSTNRRTVMKCSHCSSVNYSRTEKKSVPRASPRCALVTCVIAGSPPR
jgi:hypothetical protein